MPRLHRKSGNRLAASIIPGAFLWAGKELLMEFVFGGAADWLRNHWGIVGDFLVLRWSGPILALIVGLIIFFVTPDKEIHNRKNQDVQHTLERYINEGIAITQRLPETK
jgi:hypothetical protein